MDFHYILSSSFSIKPISFSNNYFVDEIWYVCYFPKKLTMSSGFFSGIFFILDLYHWLTYSGWSLLLWFSSLFYSFGGIIVVQVLQCWTIYVLKIPIFNRLHLRMTNKVWWIAVVLDKELVCWCEKWICFQISCPMVNPYKIFSM